MYEEVIHLKKRGGGSGNPFDYLQLKTDYTPTGTEPVGTNYWDSTKDSPSFVSNGGIVNIKEYVEDTAFISSILFG